MDLEMSEKNKFEEAIKLISEGKRKEAVDMLLVLYQGASDYANKLSIIDALLNALDSINDNVKLIEICDEGIRIAKKLHALDYKAYFMGRKAEVLKHRNINWEYQRKNLTLAPGWFGFSLVSDKNQHAEITAKIENNNREIAKLISKAQFIAERSGNQTVIAYVLTSKGSISSAQYLDFKMQCVVDKPRVVRLFKFHLLRRLILKYAWLLGKAQRRKLRTIMESFTTDYLQAAKIYEKLGDVKAGYAYYNLANQMRTSYRFRKAKQYLARAESIAKVNDDLLLHQKIIDMVKTIKAKNKDIPNYLAGETRAG